MQHHSLSNKMTVIGLVNGMIGGIILIMPIMALDTGSLLIAPVTIISALFSYFSSSLCLRHLRNFKDLDESILKHFGNNRKYKIFYDVIILISFFAILILYFGLMSDMWFQMVFQTKLIPILNAFALFPIVYLMKKFHLGASLLAYGILSIIGYCIFLAWMWSEAPTGQKKVPLVSSDFFELAAALAQGFAIQAFFIPILKQNQNRHLYGKLLIATYAIGCVVYMYIGYSGALSIGIVNLTNQSDHQKAIQIGDFFGQKQWQVILLNIIYLMHLYSAFPQFLLISKKRFFSIFKWSQPEDVDFKEVIYVAVIIFICLAIKLLQVSPQILIQLNGSIVSFFFIYIIPIALHIKCVYYTKEQDRHFHFEDEQVPKQKQIEMIEENNGKKQLKSYSRQPNEQWITSNAENQQKQAEMNQKEEKLVNQNKLQINCCEIQYKSRKHEICQIIIMIIMVLGGLSIMGFTLKKLIEKMIQ